MRMPTIRASVLRQKFSVFLRNSEDNECINHSFAEKLRSTYAKSQATWEPGIFSELGSEQQKAVLQNNFHLMETIAILVGGR